MDKIMEFIKNSKIQEHINDVFKPEITRNKIALMDEIIEQNPEFDFMIINSEDNLFSKFLKYKDVKK
jgi:hypothetical protein